MKHKPKRPKTCCLISLGCPKNLVDSEKVLGIVRAKGIRLVRDAEKADLVIVNTCAFIGPARAEARRTIEEVLRLKKRGKPRLVGVIGCFPQYASLNQTSLHEEYPDVDFVLGVFARGEIDAVLGSLGEGDGVPEIVPGPCAAVLDDSDRYRVTLAHVAYLKIAEGCNRRCAYCTIPGIRGPQQSKRPQEIVAEAKRLADEGVRELILVAQDTIGYGRDLPEGARLAELLDLLEGVRGIDWIRLMYLFPGRYVEESLIDAMNRNAKVLPYLDIPLQHTESEILARMGRPASKAFLEDLLSTLRERIDGAVLRTTLITGFPGETEAHFEAMLDFVRRLRFERLGVFAYCDEPGTPAAEFDGKVPEQIAFERCDRILDAQKTIALRWAKDRVGETHRVLIDAPLDAEDAYIGRTPADAPDIDPVVYVTGRQLTPGQIVPCEIVASQDYDLVGVPG